MTCQCQVMQGHTFIARSQIMTRLCQVVQGHISYDSRKCKVTGHDINMNCKVTDHDITQLETWNAGGTLKTQCLFVRVLFVCFLHCCATPNSDMNFNMIKAVTLQRKTICMK